MRRLLHELCDDLEGPYRLESRSRGLPISYFRFLAGHLDLRMFSGWRVNGWLEELNDLVYFLDLGRQLDHERDPHRFAESLFEQCEVQFYEHGYGGDLFPVGRPEAGGLAKRIRTLCDRLTCQVVQEAFILEPGLACRWMCMQKRSSLEVPIDLGPNFERADIAGQFPVGSTGAALRFPVFMRKRLAKRGWQATLVVHRSDIRLRIDGHEHLLATCRDGSLKWHHPVVASHTLRLKGARGSVDVTLGPTLVYGRTRVPKRVISSSSKCAVRVQRALSAIEQVWPDGANLLMLLTSRVIPLQARGVVSFSYRDRPGLSFINLFDRNRLDLIDDLIHENSHHHLNLLLRKHVLYRGDLNQEMFYSPWRRCLRPLRGILHATFTFTMGAILFERLSSFQARGTRHGARGKKCRDETWLTEAELLRARARCLEEIDSVRYSLRDLDYAAQTLGWITGAGKSVVDSIRREITRAGQRIAPHKASVLRSPYGPALERHRKVLTKARKTYGIKRAPALHRRVGR